MTKPKSGLTHRRIEILQGLADGGTPKSVGAKLNITSKTVHNHLTAVYRALEVQTIYHAIVKAWQLNLISFGGVWHHAQQ